MKHQFKFNPLATAILTLLCGGSIQSGFAATNTSHVSTLDNAQLKAKIQKDQETYSWRKFFQQYYVDKSAPEAQLRDNRYLSSSFAKVHGLRLSTLKADPKMRIAPPLLLRQTMVTTIQMVIRFYEVT